MPGISTAIAISVGQDNVCALLRGGTIKCWEINVSGQLGNGRKPYIASSATPLSVTGISTAVAVSTGANESCALLAGGSVECWGELSGGSYSFTPLAVKGI